MLDSFDAYRLAKHLRSEKPGHWMIEDTLVTYAEASPLLDTGFPIYVLKTMDDERCIFLQNNRCTVYKARPRTCRVYPITIGPGKNGLPFSYYLCGDHDHHLTGDKIAVKEWLRKNFPVDEQEFLAAEYDLLPELGRLCRKLSGHDMPKMIVSVMYHRYYNFDLDKPFLPQYLHNMKVLKAELEALVDENANGGVR